MRPITDILRDIRRGRVVEAMSDQMAEVIRAVRATNKPGSMTLVLDFKSQGRGDNAIIVSAKVTSKVPREDLPEAIFFATDEGDLLRDDPTQLRMFTDSKEETRSA